MLNREKYAKEIIEIAVESRLAVKDGKPVKCFGMICANCDLCGTKESCIENGIEWLNSEYVEPPVDWSKVAVDTPILVKNVKVATGIGDISQNTRTECCTHGQMVQHRGVCLVVAI